MGVIGNAFSEYRDVIVTFNKSEGVDIVGQTVQEAMSFDAYKAALGKVAELEAKYAANSSSVVDLTDAVVIATGTSRYKLHSFTLTLDISAARYVFVFVETVPNAASLS